MAQVRKTRQQKIKQSKRHQVGASAKGVEQSKTMVKTSEYRNADTIGMASEGPEVFGATTYHLVAAEIKKISKISLLCLGLLALTTLFISDLPGVVWVRESLGIPELF